MAVLPANQTAQAMRMARITIAIPLEESHDLPNFLNNMSFPLGQLPWYNLSVEANWEKPPPIQEAADA